MLESVFEQIQVSTHFLGQIEKQLVIDFKVTGF